MGGFGVFCLCFEKIKMSSLMVMCRFVFGLFCLCLFREKEVALDEHV